MIDCIKDFDRSINKAPAKPCLSRHNLHLSINDSIAYCVLNPFLYLQINEERNFPLHIISNLVLHYSFEYLRNCW